MKICRDCLIEKDESEFYKDRTKKGGLRFNCKECTKAKVEKYYLSRREEILSKRNVVNRARYHNEFEYREKDRAKGRSYNLKNKELISQRGKIYRQRPEVKERDRERVKLNQRRYRKNPIYKLKCSLMGRVRKALRNYRIKKRDKTLDLAGCSLEFLLLYLESKFQPGMTWENHALRGWHIDHIKPCISFDLTNPEEQKKCFHYTNLQPLWWQDNLRKGKTLPISEEGLAKAKESSSEVSPSPEPQPAERA